MTEDLIPNPKILTAFLSMCGTRFESRSWDVWSKLRNFTSHNVYGERQNIADKYRNVIGFFMNQVLQDQPMTIFGDGLQSAFSHVDDVAPLIAHSPCTCCY